MNSGRNDEAGLRLNLGALGAGLPAAAAIAAFFSESCLACSAFTCLFFLLSRKRIRPRTAPTAMIKPTASPAFPAVDIPESADDDVVDESEELEGVALLNVAEEDVARLVEADGVSVSPVPAVEDEARI